MRAERNNISREALLVRDMVTQDLVQVLTIERNAQISPWSRLSFEESLNKQHLCRVIELDGEILAYHVVCPVADELHILNVVVTSRLQGIGLGHLLMQDIVSIGGEHQLAKLFLEVRASNETAQNLYVKWQFEQIAVRKKYYSVPNGTLSSEREDAFIYLRHITKADRRSSN